jgi:hypothetical protein
VLKILTQLTKGGSWNKILFSPPEFETLSRV